MVELFDDPDNMVKWMEGLRSFEHVSGTPGRPGAKSRLIFERDDGETFEMIETLTRYNLPDEISGTYETEGDIATSSRTGSSKTAPTRLNGCLTTSLRVRRASCASRRGSCGRCSNAIRLKIHARVQGLCGGHGLGVGGAVGRRRVGAPRPKLSAFREALTQVLGPLPYPFAPVSSTGRALSLSKGLQNGLGRMRSVSNGGRW